MEEIWKDIPGFEGLYQASSLGRIKHLPNKIRVAHLKGGYLAVNLSKENKVRWFLIHRLVAESFLPNPNNLPCVNHKDEDKTNNRIDNLEWCTYAYNANYGTGVHRQVLSRFNNPYDFISRKKVGEMNSRAVRQLSPDGKLIATYKSLSDASEASGVNIATIIRQCKGKCVKARKYKFEYV